MRAIVMVVGSDLYGLSRTALDAAAPLQDGAHRVELWSSDDGPLLDLAEEQGLVTRVVPIPVLRRSELVGLRLPVALAGVAIEAVRLWRLARRERDVAMVHAMGAPNLGGLLVAAATRAPLIWSAHEVFGSEVEARFFRALFRRATTRVACSAYVATQFGSLAPTFRVVHSGTDVTEVGGKRPDRAESVVICVGRLNRWKGQDVLLRAFAALPEERRRAARLQIVGSPFKSEQVVTDELSRLAAELGIVDRVEFLGERPDARRLMAEADIVVVPSKKPEPFGRVVVEALALGRAVIATTPGGPAEVIDNGVDGILVPANDPGAIAAALDSLLSDPWRAHELGERGRRTAARFGAEVARGGYREAYREAGVEVAG